MSKLKVKSYDMFDTLVARKCHDPKEIFEQVSTITGCKSFPRVRVETERRLYSKPNFTFDDIYENMDQNELEYDKDYLKKVELQVEEANLFPIKEMIDKLRPHDIVVSDMYLSPDFLKKFLPKYVTLIVTPYGKADGSIWEELKEHYDIEEHFGDNPHSDVNSPSKSGIKSTLVDVSRPTPNEVYLKGNQLPLLSSLCRELRLRTYNEDNLHRTLEEAECDINIPLLMLAGEHILRTASKNNVINILISGRDGGKLSDLMKLQNLQVWGDKFNVEYFYTSRMSRRTASSSYIEYIDSLVKDHNTLIVDLDGTGWTLRHLLDRINEENPDLGKKIQLYLFHYLDEANLPGFMARPHEVTEYPILHAFFTNKFQHNRLELLNLTNHPMVKDVAKIRNNFVPIFYDEGHNEKTSEYVVTMNKIFNELYAYLDVTNFQEIHHLSDGDLLSIMDYIYSSLDNVDKSIFDELEIQQREEEVGIEKALSQ